MNSFAVWVASPAGTAILAMLALALGLVLGEMDGIPRGRRHEAEDIEREEAEDRAAEDAWRQARQPTTAQIDAIREAGRRAWAIQQERDASVELYPGQALAVVADDPSVSAWTEAMAASMDAWLAEHVYGVPYSADELWSGQ